MLIIQFLDFTYSYFLLLSSRSFLFLWKSSKASLNRVMHSTNAKGAMYVIRKPIKNVVTRYKILILTNFQLWNKLTQPDHQEKEIIKHFELIPKDVWDQSYEVVFLIVLPISRITAWVAPSI